MGVKTILLTGDIEAVAQQVAKTLNIADYRADLLPEDKLAYVRALVSQKHAVAMVGDGVNDAPALSAATIGIAMGSGTDIAKESAQVVLIGNDLLKLAETIRIARQTRSIIWQNFVGTLLVDAIGIGMAAFGYLNPLLAAFIHVGSELLFLSNSARLLTLEQISPLTRKNGSAVQQEAQT
jgi:P-type E1-E2 ATPase